MKKAARKVRDDPIVAEVRRWRAKMVKKAGGTVKGLMDHLRAQEANRTAAAPKPAPRRRKSA